MWLYIVLGIVGFIVLLLLIALAMPKSYSLSSEIVIKRSQADVFDYVVHLKNQEKYSKWVMMDPNVQLTYTGTDGTVGFKAAWKSDVRDVGIGEQEITKITPGTRYDVELRFEKPFKATNYAHTTVTSVNNAESKVVTTFEARTPFPMNLMVPMIKNMLLQDMKQNAAQLKKNLES